jgi:hypothetical protein
LRLNERTDRGSLPVNNLEERFNARAIAGSISVSLKRWLKQVSARSGGNKNAKINQMILLLVQKVCTSSRIIWLILAFLFPPLRAETCFSQRLRETMKILPAIAHLPGRRW